MKRTTYKGIVIDTDDLGRVYIYDPRSSYSEENDHILTYTSSLKDTKQFIDQKLLEYELEQKQYQKICEEYKEG